MPIAGNPSAVVSSGLDRLGSAGAAKDVVANLFEATPTRSRPSSCWPTVTGHPRCTPDSPGTPRRFAAFDAAGLVTNTDCNNGWVCVDRFRGVANMLGWHNYAGRGPVANWYDDGNILAAFSRGDRAFVAINNETTRKTIRVRTGMATGRYCDIIHGSLVYGGCSGPTVTIGSDGHATVTVPAKDAVAFDRISRL